MVYRSDAQGHKPLLYMHLKKQATNGVQNYYKTMRKTIFARVNKQRQGYPSNTKDSPALYKSAISLQFLLHVLADGLTTQTALEDCAVGSKENDVRY